MTDRQIVQWLRDEADYWRTGLSNGGIHPDGEEADTIKMCEAAAKRLEELTPER